MIEPVKIETIQPSSARRSKILYAAVGAAAVAAVLYVTMTGGGKESEASPECADSDRLLSALTQLERGEMAAATSPKRARPAAPLRFQGPDGAPRTLADFKGRVVLLNLWATWCAPCREEMPTLDRLQAELGGPDFEVIALNLDTTRAERARTFLETISAKNLAFYADPSGDVFYQLKKAGKLTGLPTTYLIGKDGCETASLAGAAHWDSPDALALLRTSLGK